MTVIGTFNSWIEAMKSGDVSRIVSLYNDDSILLPTFSHIIHETNDKKIEYFKAISTLQNLSIVVKEQYVQVFDNFATISGIYTFIHDTVIHTEINARFTFVYVLKNNEYKIVNHHSSPLSGELSNSSFKDFN
jgi:hypothetical protein